MADNAEEKQKVIEMLRLAQEHNSISEHDVIVYIINTYMRKRLYKYLHRNRQAEDDDIKQEFMIGVALAIKTVRFDIGDPIEYLVSQGIYRVRSFLRKQIIQNTVQVCNECGHITRMNRIGNDYICRRCGSSNISTNEINDNNELVLDAMPDSDMDIGENVVSSILIDRFEQTLDINTNVYKLYQLLMSGVNRDNPQIKNYIKEISKLWGGCSEQNVVQNMDKLKKRITQFAEDNNLLIEDNRFIFKEDKLGGL